MDITRTNAVATQAAQLRPAGIARQKPAAPLAEPVRTAESGAADHQDVSLNRAEKEYFAEAFPAAAREVHQHVVYQKNGTKLPASLGTVVDRKG